MNLSSELNIDSVRDFIIYRGGKVKNHELVKHFRNELTDPSTRVEARNVFKEIVNDVASIVRCEDGEKYLILKKKYRPHHQSDQYSNVSTPTMSPEPFSHPYPSSNNMSSRYSSQDSLHSNSSGALRQPPPYRPPPSPLVTTPPHLSPHLILNKSPPINFSHPSSGQFSPSSIQMSKQPFSNHNMPNYPVQNSSIQHPPPFKHANSFNGSPQKTIPFINNSQRSISFDQTYDNRSQFDPRSAQFDNRPMQQHDNNRNSSEIRSQFDNRQIQDRSQYIDNNRQNRPNLERPTTLELPASALDGSAPPVPPRRRNSEKSLQHSSSNSDMKENMPASSTPVDEDKTPVNSTANTPVDNVEDNEPTNISVKECMMKFNRLASENALQATSPTHKPASSVLSKRFDKHNSQQADDDTVSMTSLDQTAKKFLVKAAQADYQSVAKMISDNPRLISLKHPFIGYAPIHWAAKHGNADLVKLIAGTFGADVNIRTNGGYTPLHLAMQFGREEVYQLLVQVYGADPEIRDYSGKKPRQYQINQDTSVSADTFRKLKARKKHSERDLGFLRIGSLNVRVKKTTEAFSNFLVGKSETEKLHKTWGSADNLNQGDTRMAPPKFAPIKKRKSKRAADYISRSTPTTPDFKSTSRPHSAHSLNIPIMGTINNHRTNHHNSGDSDSDTACGFDNNWKGS